MAIWNTDKNKGNFKVVQAVPGQRLVQNGDQSEQ